MIEPVIMQSLGWFVAASMIASIVGFLSYGLIRWICEKSPDYYLMVSALVASVVGCITLLILPERWVYMGVSALVWSLATFAERTAHPSEEGWFETLFKLGTATVCSTMLNFIVLGCTIFTIFSGSLPPQDEVWFLNGFLTGSLISPSAISISLWIWKTLQRRPGYDIDLGDNPK